LVSLAMAGALAYDGPFWASASRAMPVAVAGGAMGLINAIGNLGGFIGPFVGGYLQQRSGHFLTTSYFLAAALLLAGLVMLTVRVKRAPEIEPEDIQLVKETRPAAVDEEVEANPAQDLKESMRG
jgi:MFS family permease